MATKQLIREQACGADNCTNNVQIYEHEKYKYQEQSDFSCSTTSGYRCCSGCSKTYHFCSDTCLKLFEAHKRCSRCHERCLHDKDGLFIEELNITLCNGRGDHNPPCSVKYQIEQRFKNDYTNTEIKYIGKVKYNISNKSYSRITICNMVNEYDEIFDIIRENDNKITLDMLKDINYIDNEYAVRDRKEDKLDELSNDLSNDKLDELSNDLSNDKLETYKMCRCIDCNKNLISNFYYVGGDVNGLTCCNIKVKKEGYTWMQYYYKESSDYFIVEICNTE